MSAKQYMLEYDLLTELLTKGKLATVKRFEWICSD